MFRNAYIPKKSLAVVLTYACTSGKLWAQAHALSVENVAPSRAETAGLFSAASPEELVKEDYSQTSTEPEAGVQSSKVSLLSPSKEEFTGFNPRPFRVIPGQLLQGFQWGLGMSSIYESDLRRDGQETSDGSTGGDNSDRSDNDDLVLGFSPWIAWKTESQRWSVFGQAGLQYSEYLKNGQLGGLGYEGHLGLGYAGGSARIAGSFDYTLERGGNRYYGAFIEEQRLGISLTGAYKFSPRTSLDANISFSWSDPSNADTEESLGSLDQFNQTEDYGAHLAAVWQATPLIRLGPGISYSRTGGENYEGREALGPILQVGYRLAEKVNLNGTVGFEYALNQRGGISGNNAPTINLVCDYRASILWSANASVTKSIQANGSESNSYRDTTVYRLGLTRKILRAQVEVGVSYELGDVASSLSSNRGKDSLESFTSSVMLNMPIAKRMQGSIFASWRDDGGYRSSGSGYSAGLSLSLSF